MNEDLTDAQIRSICEKNGIKVGPLTSSTRKIYLKKIEKIQSTVDTKSDSIETILEKGLHSVFFIHVDPIITVNQLTKNELAKIPNNEFSILMDYFDIKKMPLNDASKKIIASKIYLKLHNVENMDWEYADEDLAELDL